MRVATTLAYSWHRLHRPRSGLPVGAGGTPRPPVRSCDIVRVTIPVVLGSANARVGLPAAIAALRAGRSAMDAAVAAVKCVEDNRDDHGVGTGGIPNVLGQVELDASVMDGRTL